MKLTRLSFIFLLCVSFAACTHTPQRPAEIGADEQWIEVDVPNQIVRLHTGNQVVGEYLASTGVNTSPETTTYTGLFEVQQMLRGPVESVPGVFVTDVVIFDMTHGIGFHSKPMDKAKNIFTRFNKLPEAMCCIS